MSSGLRTAVPFVVAIFVIIFGIFGAEALNLYYLWEHFDKVMHFTGGLVAVWCMVTWLEHELAAIPPVKQFGVVIGLVCLIGVLWEFAEYGGTLARSAAPWLYHYFHIGNLVDTLGDLVADLTGGTLFILFRSDRAR